MSDVSTDAGVSDAAAPAEAPAEAPAPESTPDPAAAAVADAQTAAETPAPEAPGFLDGVPDEVKAHVKGLRDESASYRVKARDLETQVKPYQEVFEGVDPAARDAVLQMAKVLVNDPENAGPKELIRVARALVGDRFDDVVKSLDEPQYLTPDQLEAQLAEREAKAAEERERREALESVEKESRELGYEDDTPDKTMLFFYAYKHTDGDLQAAHAKVQEFKQSVIDGYVQSVKEGNSSFPAVSGAVVPGAADPAEPAKTLEEAGSRVRARLAALAGADG